MSRQHALLSASSAHRWINCPPSAKLQEQYEDKSSAYAEQGTDAHALAEWKLRKALGMETYAVSAPSGLGLLPTYWVREWFGILYEWIW